jgi:hypothetical protein
MCAYRHALAFFSVDPNVRVISRSAEWLADKAQIIGESSARPDSIPFDKTILFSNCSRPLQVKRNWRKFHFGRF